MREHLLYPSRNPSFRSARSLRARQASNIEKLVTYFLKAGVKPYQAASIMFIITIIMFLLIIINLIIIITIIIIIVISSSSPPAGNFGLSPAKGAKATGTDGCTRQRGRYQ